jgi:hypothetical protein
MLMVGVPPISSLRRNSILVTGMSPLMLKARLMGSKTSSTGVSTTEELLSEEDSDSELTELSEMLEELLLAGLEETEAEGAEGAAGAELETLEGGVLEVLEALELAELAGAELEELLEEPPGTMSLTPALFQTAVKETFWFGAETWVPGWKILPSAYSQPAKTWFSYLKEQEIRVKFSS